MLSKFKPLTTSILKSNNLQTSIIVCLKHFIEMVYIITQMRNEVFMNIGDIYISAENVVVEVKRFNSLQVLVKKTFDDLNCFWLSLEELNNNFEACFLIHKKIKLLSAFNEPNIIRELLNKEKRKYKCR